MASPNPGLSGQPNRFFSSLKNNESQIPDAFRQVERSFNTRPVSAEVINANSTVITNAAQTTLVLTGSAINWDTNPNIGSQIGIVDIANSRLHAVEAGLYLHTGIVQFVSTTASNAVYTLFLVAFDQQNNNLRTRQWDASFIASEAAINFGFSIITQANYQDYWVLQGKIKVGGVSGTDTGIISRWETFKLGSKSNNYGV